MPEPEEPNNPNGPEELLIGEEELFANGKGSLAG